MGFISSRTPLFCGSGVKLSDASCDERVSSDGLWTGRVMVE